MKITKEYIIQVSLPLFQEKGYDNVTINEICEAAGITKPTLYNYISSKEDLILDLYDNSIRDILGDTIHFVVLESSYEQLLYTFYKLTEDTKKYGASIFSQMVISNLKENKGSFRMRKVLTDMCLVFIKKAQENKEILNTEDPILIYTTIAHLFTGFEVMWAINKQDYSLEENFFKAFNTVLMVSDQYKDIYKKYI